MASVLTLAAAALTLWHSYRGAEESALVKQLARVRERTGVDVQPLAIPHEAFASKLTNAIPRGHGPDLFIFAHERIGGWAETGLIAPQSAPEGVFLPAAAQAVTYRHSRQAGAAMWALPLSVKSLALFYNKRLVQTPPQTTDGMIALAALLSDPPAGRYGLVWQTTNFYQHHAWLAGFGGSVFDAEHRIKIDTPEARAALAFVRRMQDQRLLPEEVSGTLVTQLFNEGRAAMVVNGPWFMGEIQPGVEYGVAVLPTVSETGKPAAPFLTSEAVFVSAFGRDVQAALGAARTLALDEEIAVLRAVVGRQVPALRAAADSPAVAGDPVLAVFRAQAERAVPMDNTPAMRRVWEPAELALRRGLRSAASPEEALRAGQRRLAALDRPRPERAPVWPYLVGVMVAAGAVLVWARRKKGTSLFSRAGVSGRVSGTQYKAPAGGERTEPAHRVGNVALRSDTTGYAWVAPAIAGMAILVAVPFAWGAVLAFFQKTDDGFDFVGLANFWSILSSRDYPLSDPLSFWFTLAVTVLWTVVNVALHAAIGLALALLLDRPLGRLRPIYRVLLVLPWAVPNYITALVWKGMFHRQFGAINALLTSVGLEPVSWFAQFSTAFAANVAANTWLGFPFMMVVCLGALQSIPRELYEAAEVDGASAWMRFRHVTLPLLQPALVPALILGSVWTFNMFNIVFLVSGGEPDGATNILVSEAYRWAFTREEQYGYAAAYAILIFAILVGWSAVTSRLTRSAEPAR